MKPTKTLMLGKIGGVASKLKQEKHSSIIVDSQIAILFPALMQMLPQDRVLVIPGGEESKSWQKLEKILSWLAMRKKERSERVIAVGGGAICDLVAMAASLYKRGAPLVFVPTTMLAQIDAALGGKTAIDADFGGLKIKNFAGTFYPAEEVWICAEFLNTLPERERRSGIGELLKMCWLYGKKSPSTSMLQDWVHRGRIHKDLWRFVEFSIAAKAKVVKQDPLDNKRIREALNYGHTVGHAIESLAMGEISHGEAVAWGMWIETKFLKSKFAEEISEVLAHLDFQAPDILGDTKAASYAVLFASDKKIKKGKLEITAALKPGSRKKNQCKPEVLAAFCEKQFLL